MTPLPKASPGGKLSSVARLMRNAGGKLTAGDMLQTFTMSYRTPFLTRLLLRKIHPPPGGGLFHVPC